MTVAGSLALVEWIIAVGTIGILALTALLIYITVRSRRPELEVSFNGSAGAHLDGVMLGVMVRNHGRGTARRVRVSAWINDTYHSEAAPVTIGAGDWREVKVTVGPPAYMGATANGYPSFNGQLSVRARCTRSDAAAVWPYN